MKLYLPIVYYVNKKDGVVTARFKNSFINLQRLLNFHSPVSTPYVNFDYNRVDLEHYISMAKCMSEDKFDENVGKEIARRRLLRSLYIDLDIILQEVEKQLEMAKKGISIQRSKLRAKKIKLREELEEYKGIGVKKLEPSIIKLSISKEEKKEAAEK